MALERNQDGIRLGNDDLARSHEQRPLHDKDITIVMFQLVCVFRSLNFLPLSHANTNAI